MSDLPIGSIVAMLQSETSYPEGWLLCNGDPCPEKYLDNLKEYLADKKTLPNLQGYTLVGAGTGTYTDGTQYTYTVRSRYGVLNSKHTLNVDEMPSHQHFGYGNADSYGVGFGTTERTGFRGNRDADDSDDYLYGTSWAGGTKQTTDKTDVSIPTTNGSQTTSKATVNNPFSINVMQPSFAINYFIYAGKPHDQ